MAFTPKKKVEEEEDEEPIMEEEEEVEDLDAEDEDERRPVGRRTNAEKAAVAKQFQKTPAVYQRPEPVIKGRGWIIKSIPAIFQCIDTINGEIVCEAGSYEELMLKLQIMATQHSVESAKNTR